MSLASPLLFRFALWLVCAAPLNIAGADETEFPSPPFVSAVDRFGRHQELDETLAGQILVSELACAACHATNDLKLAAKTGPSLVAAGRQFQRDWLTAYLLDPASTKPGTTMPDVMQKLDAPERREAVESLVAFLSTRQAEYPNIKATGANPVRHEFWMVGDAEVGRRLYHEVGCVACHEPDPTYEVAVMAESAVDRLLEELDLEELADMGLAGAARRVHSVPHGDLSAKYTRSSLAYFLYDPGHTRPSGRMPSLNLKTQEAADITEYLLAGQPKSTPVAMESSELSTAMQRVAKGKFLFASLGCAQCHQAGVPAVDRFAKPINQCDPDTDQTCGAKPEGKMVHYPLDELQHSVIRKALLLATGGNGSEATSQPAPKNMAVTRTMMQLNCYGCHARNGLGGVGRFRKNYFETVGRVDLGDEGRLPPPLTGVGRKLKEPWIKAVLQGDPKSRLRPHMTIRMPKFHGPMVAALPNEFAEADKVDIAADVAVFGKLKAIAEEGQALMDIGCIQCHAFGGKTMPGVIGIDLAGVPDRIHARWFSEFLMDPGKLKERTRMPTFFPEGKSQNLNVLNGDSSMQIAAMWDYLKEVDKLGVPKQIEQAYAKDYQLHPSDRPILLRTFLTGVGTHGIAVGLPGGTHFAFDAAKPRVAVGWKDGFLDARSTWYERLAPPVNPIGGSIRVIDPDLAVARLTTDSSVSPAVTSNHDDRERSVRFLGYRLDSEGVPTFRYRVDATVFSDRIASHSEGGLRRTVTIESDSSTTDPLCQWYFCGSSGRSLKVTSDSCQNESSVTTHLLTSYSKATVVKSVEGIQRWMIPINLNTSTEVVYQW